MILPEFVYRIINFGYNLFYKLLNKHILTQKDRYEISKYLNSKDKESQLLGARLLTEFYTGTDKVSDCSLRITWDDDKPIKFRNYFKLGGLQMSETITIQEVINKIKTDLDNNNLQEILGLLRIIGYYFAYHPRIGGQISSAYFDSIRYPALFQEQKIYINNSNVHTWDWYRSKWAFPIKAKKYWQKHKKPENLYL